MCTLQPEFTVLPLGPESAHQSLKLATVTMQNTILIQDLSLMTTPLHGSTRHQTTAWAQLGCTMVERYMYIFSSLNTA